jgi:hypothetical protein
MGRSVQDLCRGRCECVDNARRSMGKSQIRATEPGSWVAMCIQPRYGRLGPNFNLANYEVRGFAYRLCAARTYLRLAVCPYTRNFLASRS